MYISTKLKKAAEIGAQAVLVKLPDTTTQRELEAEIDRLNNDNNIDGIIVQVCAFFLEEDVICSNSRALTQNRSRLFCHMA